MPTFFCVLALIAAMANGDWFACYWLYAAGVFRCMQLLVPRCTITKN